MMAGLLFARAGLKVTVLEKHKDFLRDFRGDTVHPSTLELFHELGWLDELLALDHKAISTFSATFSGHKYELASLATLPVKAPFIAMMPQWDLLDFLARKASQYSGFALKMDLEATNLLFDGDRVAGVSTSLGVERATLTLLCAGRGNALTKQSKLPGKSYGSPMDVLWFRIEKDAAKHASTGFYVSGGGLIVTIDRNDYWQVAMAINKGEAGILKAKGLDAIKQQIIEIAPILSEDINSLESVDDLKLLNVQMDQLEQWSRPGLLAIGDAAHAMSPIAGVGINLAVQDAVAAANIIVPAFLAGGNIGAAAQNVQKRRLFPASATQALQRVIQKQVIGKSLEATGAVQAPLPIRLIGRFPFLGGLAARFVGLGFRPEHIQTPETK